MTNKRVTLLDAILFIAEEGEFSVRKAYQRLPNFSESGVRTGISNAHKRGMLREVNRSKVGAHEIITFQITTFGREYLKNPDAQIDGWSGTSCALAQALGYPIYVASPKMRPRLVHSIIQTAE